MDESHQLASHSLGEVDQHLKRKWGVRTAAREAFIELQCDETLRRSLLRRPRVCGWRPEVGERVFL